MNKLDQLAALGQSVWYDYIHRDLLTSGALQALIEEGLRGMTSNPTIFDKAIGGSSDYDQDLARLAAAQDSLEAIYEGLALPDIAAAADRLRPVYDRTGGADGFVSLEVNPALAHDTGATVAAARRLFGALGRPNVMIKVPATRAGVPAVATLIGKGVNVNVTLMFSLAHYRAVADAYLDGLEQRAVRGEEVAGIASVASFFVSRVDTAVDRALAERDGDPRAAALQGRIAIANAKLAYAAFQEAFGGARWQALAARGARVQRVLWASTGTKNPDYSDTLYIDELIGPHTVNTMPPDTLQAFLDHGTVAPTLARGVEEARAQVDRLAELGIDLDAITEALQRDGVRAFADSFDNLLASIARKRKDLRRPAAGAAN